MVGDAPAREVHHLDEVDLIALRRGARILPDELPAVGRERPGAVPPAEAGPGRAQPPFEERPDLGAALQTALPGGRAHLGELREGGLPTVETQGRHRSYRLAGPLATALLRAFCARGWLRRAETGRAVQAIPKGWIARRTEPGLAPASCGDAIGLPGREVP